MINLNLGKESSIKTLAHSLLNQMMADHCWLVSCDRDQVEPIEIIAFPSGEIVNNLSREFSGITEQLTPQKWQFTNDRSLFLLGVGYGQGAIILGRNQPWNDQEILELTNWKDKFILTISQAQGDYQRSLNIYHHQLSTLLTEGIIQGIDLGELSQRSIDFIQSALELDQVFILNLQYQKSGKKSQIMGTISQQKNEDRSNVWDLTNAPWCQDVVNNNKILTVYDLSIDHTSSLQELATSGAIAIVPFTNHDTTSNYPVWGLLIAKSDRPRYWYHSELTLIKTLGQQLTIARIHQNSTKQVQTLVAERTANLQSSYQLQAKINEASRRHIEQLRRLNELKDDFVSTISHELRTPLTKMAVAIRMLKQAELDKVRQERYLGILEDECNQEIKLINDVLALQQLESKQWQMSTHPVELVTLIKYTAKLFQDIWENKNLELELILPPSLTIISEQQSLQNILQELFTNAAKYATENSKITCELYRIDNDVKFTITNQGLMINKADLPHIFEKFRRGEGATKKAIAGTGLGLALVKLLVDHLQGTIQVSSKRIHEINQNLGITSFTITLPINITTDN